VPFTGVQVCLTTPLEVLSLRKSSGDPKVQEEIEAVLALPKG
jgi:hypothetical protein